MESNKIEQIIKDGITNCSVKVVDDGFGHYEAEVISDIFKDIGTLDRHKMVFATLGSLVGNEIHALSLKTYTEDEHSNWFFRLR